MRTIENKETMSLKICVLASSSAANSTLIESETTRILIDAGLSARETGRRLEGLGCRLEDVSAICVTHEHDDHLNGIPVIHRRHGIALYANHGTADAVKSMKRFDDASWNVFSTGSPFTIGDITLEPFSVPHDGYEPVGFVVRSGACRAGVVTDMGMSTNLIRQRLQGCHALVLECNYDSDLLMGSRRPWSLKQRISGRQGHLSNQQAAELISELAGPELQAVFLAHLSRECNSPALAEKAIADALRQCGRAEVAVHLTYPDRVSAALQL